MDRWTAVIPVKPLDLAKSRLAAEVAGADALAFAFLEDVLTALAGAARVADIVVATSDADVAATAAAANCRIVDDSDHPGINAAAEHAAHLAGVEGATVVLVSDLPCLDATTVDAVLERAGRHRTSFLPDHAGTGTTMWCTTDAHLLRPAFGRESAARHRAAGAVDLTTGSDAADLIRARMDVDTLTELLEAERLGVGPATSAVLAPRTTVGP